jgi:hypothetical protein
MNFLNFKNIDKSNKNLDLKIKFRVPFFREFFIMF